MAADRFDTLREFPISDSRVGRLHSLPALAGAGVADVARLPFSIRIMLESLLRNCGDGAVTEEHVRALAGWKPHALRSAEIPFVVSRILCPDSSGAPLLADLAAMRDAAERLGADPGRIEPLVPVDLIVDHSVQVDHYGDASALARNMEIEFARNGERYRFLKWAAQAFDAVRIIPPGVGICHQVNLEYLARGVWERGGVFLPDTLVGADSHTTMINGIGVVGWGVGGIEADGAMLGQPIYLLTPDVIGVELAGRLRPGVTATDLVLSVVETLRRARVVGKFVEFFGDGAASLTVQDRATISNMAPEYGATIGLFPVDAQTVAYFRATGRADAEIAAFEGYFRAQGMFGMPRLGDLDYSATLTIDLDAIVPSVAGPRRPQDRIALPDLPARMTDLLAAPAEAGGYGRPPAANAARHTVSGYGRPGQSVEQRVANPPADIGDGDVLLAAITSCTNTSNPSVLLAAGLLARNAVERGLSVRPWVKTSLGPGSRATSEYLRQAGLQPHLDALGFQVIGYGCTTCIGNSGPLDPTLERAVTDNGVIAAAVLSGNRNFEARIHQSLKANFIMSPPLVVAFALAGRVGIELTSEPLGIGADKRPVYLADIWPSAEDVAGLMRFATDPETFRRSYAELGGALWEAVESPTGPRFRWERGSTYLRQPPFFERFSRAPDGGRPIAGARALAILGNSVTTDHISPGGAIAAATPAGEYLQGLGVDPVDFNSYIARRTNHEVMMRGTFANVRLRNLMVPGSEGSRTRHQPSGQDMSIYAAAMAYRREGVPLVVLAGEEYGTGSSRDWAAKGTQLLGVRAVVARSFERIHRGSLVHMGVLPCQFATEDSVASLGLDGSEGYAILGVPPRPAPRQPATLAVRRADGSVASVPLIVRIDTPAEADYYHNGGIMPFILRDLLTAA